MTQEIMTRRVIEEAKACTYQSQATFVKALCSNTKLTPNEVVALESARAKVNGEITPFYSNFLLFGMQSLNNNERKAICKAFRLGMVDLLTHYEKDGYKATVVFK